MGWMYLVQCVLQFIAFCREHRMSRFVQRRLTDVADSGADKKTLKQAIRIGILLHYMIRFASGGKSIRAPKDAEGRVLPVTESRVFGGAPAVVAQELLRLFSEAQPDPKTGEYVYAPRLPRLRLVVVTLVPLCGQPDPAGVLDTMRLTTERSMRDPACCRTS